MFSDLPDPLFQIWPVPVPDIFSNLRSGQIRFGSIFQFKIRPVSDPDPKCFKFYVVLIEIKLIILDYYNTIN